MPCRSNWSPHWLRQLSLSILPSAALDIFEHPSPMFKRPAPRKMGVQHRSGALAHGNNALWILEKKNKRVRKRIRIARFNNETALVLLNQLSDFPVLRCY